MLDKRKHKIDICECGLLLVLQFALSFSICVEFSIIHLYDWMIIKVEELSDLFNTLFSIQASVSTITIAILALITGFANESMYGIAVTDYLMQLRPYILKHRRIIIINLCLIILNYVLVSYKLYNISISIFGICVVLSIKMIIDISTIFYGKRFVKNEIRKFLIENYSENILSDINDDTISAIDANNSAVAIDNMVALTDLFQIELQKCSQSNITVELKYMESILSDIFFSMLSSSVWNETKNAKIFEIFSLLYEKANGDEKAPIPLKIWDSIQKEYYTKIAQLPFDELRNNFIISRIHGLLYCNANVITNKNGRFLLNCYELEKYASKLYYSFFKTNTNSFLDKHQSQSIKRWLFESIEIMLEKPLKYEDSFKKDMLNKELCRYLLLLVNNSEQNIIIECIFNSFSKSIVPKFYALICLYYLSDPEILYENETKKSVEKIINDNQDLITDFLLKFDYTKFLVNDLNLLTSELSSWEFATFDGSKGYHLASVVEDFIIFSALIRYWDGDMIKPLVKMITRGEPFVLYNRYFSKDNELKNDFLKFTKKMYNIDLQAEINDKLDILRDVLNQIYLEFDIEKGLSIELKNEEYELIIREIETKVKEHVFQINDIFSNTRDKNILEKRIILLDLTLPTSSIREISHDEYIMKLIETHIVEAILLIIGSHIKMREVQYDYRNKQTVLLSLAKEVMGTINTVIGNKDVFWGEDDIEEFHRYSVDMKRIKFPHGQNTLVLIDSDLLYLHVKRIWATIEDLTDDEIKSNCYVDYEGQTLYNVANDFYIPISNDLLNEHYHRIRKRILVYADYEYTIRQDIIGCGIKITYDG